MKVGELLRDAARRLADSGSETPRLDAEVLLGHALRVDRATLLAEPLASVGDEHAASFLTLVERRSTGEPVSYIRGIKEFYGLALTVDSRALIPRPETELLVDLALGRISHALTSAPRSADAGPLRILDIGTGSGAVAVAIAVETRRRRYAGDVQIVATDISADALSLAVENAVVHGVADAIQLVLGDFDAGQGPADVLLANLPYVPSAVVPTLPVAASFEPASALDGGPDGLDLIRGLAERVPEVVSVGGVALLEIGSDQADAVRRIVLERAPACDVVIHDDLAGRPRVAEIRRPA